MSLKAKIAIGVVIALVASAAVTGIAFLSARQDDTVEEMGLYVGDQRVEDPGVILTVDGNEVSFEDYRYYYLMNKSYIDQSYGAGYWDADYDGAKALDLRKTTEQTILQLYTWLKVAEEEGITLTDEEVQEIQNTMNEQKETLGAEVFERNLNDMFFTSEAMYLRITEQQQLVQKAQKTLLEQYTTEVKDNLDDYYATAKHILVSFDAFSTEAPTPEEELLDEMGEYAADSAEGTQADDSASVPADSASETNVQMAETSEAIVDEAAADGSSSLAGEAATGEEAAADDMTEEEREAAAKEFAEGLLAQLRAVEAEGGDVEALFDEMVVQYGMDPGMEENPDGYTFPEGQMVEEFYEGTMALDVGEISEPIRTDYGYHIIMRMPLREEDIGEDVDATIESLATTLMSERMTEEMEGLTVEYGSYYTEIMPGSVK